MGRFLTTVTQYREVHIYHTDSIKYLTSHVTSNDTRFSVQQVQVQTSRNKNKKVVNYFSD